MAPTRRIPKLPHHHARVTTVFVGQRGGIPYELERTSCTVCRRVLAERPLPRAVAPLPGGGIRRIVRLRGAPRSDCEHVHVRMAVEREVERIAGVADADRLHDVL